VVSTRAKKKTNEEKKEGKRTERGEEEKAMALTRTR